MDCTFLPYEKTHAFSGLVLDYLANKESLKAFYRYRPDPEGMSEAISQREKHPVNRSLLVKVLREQYEGIPLTGAAEKNLELLSSESTFTVCTAHQPNLLTGYLYFIYKIVHAIVLAEELNKQFPGKHFVPVYYLGSEDNDLQELGTFRYNNERFTWDGGGQSGAVGRMSTESLQPLIRDLFKKLGPPGPHCDELKQLLENAYTKQPTIGKATAWLVNALFGNYGLLVIDPDHSGLKRAFIPVMKEDLLEHSARQVLGDTVSALAANYKVQAYPRAINLFYLTDGLRERIEQKGERWQVLNTDITWSREELLTELEQYPERFSPNVILRGLFQESILPNVAFIGGGAELAYWLQLCQLFEHYKVFFPAIHLRQSVTWINSAEHRLREQLGLSLEQVFKPETDLIHSFVRSKSGDQWQTNNELQEMEQVLSALRSKAITLDPTLKGASEAVTAKIRYQLQVLEKKMLRAEKRKMQVELQRIEKLKRKLFPGGSLQERTENFMEYYLQYGAEFIGMLHRSFQPYRHEFLIVEEQ